MTFCYLSIIISYLSIYHQLSICYLFVYCQSMYHHLYFDLSTCNLIDSLHEVCNESFKWFISNFGNLINCVSIKDTNKMYWLPQNSGLCSRLLCWTSGTPSLTFPAVLMWVLPSPSSAFRRCCYPCSTSSPPVVSLLSFSWDWFPPCWLLGTTILKSVFFWCNLPPEVQISRCFLLGSPVAALYHRVPNKS